MLAVGLVALLATSAAAAGSAAARHIGHVAAGSPWRAASTAPLRRFVAAELPDSAAGRRARRLIEAKRLRLLGVAAVKPNAVAAIVRDAGGKRLVLTVFVDRTGRIDYTTLKPPAALPPLTGRAVVGSDRVELVDRARANRRVMLTRWYPAAGDAGNRPPAQYAGPQLAAALAAQYAADPKAAAAALSLPAVHTHARAGAQARRGALPVVLFSPGGGASRVLYQSVAEELASHGYLVVSVDHSGDAPIELADGTIMAATGHGIPDRARLDDMRFVLRNLNRMGPGPHADRRRVASIGHSVGGATAAMLMRAEPSIVAGIDMDGLILGSAVRRGVPGPFMVMSAGKGLFALPSMRGLLAHTRSPLLALQFSGFEHFSFSDVPAIAPETLTDAKRPSARDLIVQNDYVRAFLDRYVRGRYSRLLAGPSPRWPQVSIRQRNGIEP